MKKEIGIVDIGYGNIGSVYNAVQFLGFKPSLETKSKNLKKYSHLILPGVGSFAKNSEIINHNGISGSHALIENDYLVFAYYRDIGAEYDSLIGVGKCNSFNLQN